MDFSQPFSVLAFRARIEGRKQKGYDIYTHRDGNTEYVVKFGIEEEIDVQLLNEIHLLPRLNHPNIIKLWGYGFAEPDELFTIMPRYASNLTSLIELFQQDTSGRWRNTLRSLIRDMTAPLNYLHDHHIIHRDVKPDNYLVSRSGLVLADFGLALPMAQHAAYKQYEVCTLRYRELRLLQGERNYGPEVDMWALGCSIYELVHGSQLFTGINVRDMTSTIECLLGSEDDPIPYMADERWRTLVSNLVCLDVSKRWDAKQCLAHIGYATDSVPLSGDTVLATHTPVVPGHDIKTLKVNIFDLIRVCNLETAIKYLQACIHLDVNYAKYSEAYHHSLVLACVYLAALVIDGDGLIPDLYALRDEALEIGLNVSAQRAERIVREIIMQPGYIHNPATILHVQPGLYNTPEAWR